MSEEQRLRQQDDAVALIRALHAWVVGLQDEVELAFEAGENLSERVFDGVEALRQFIGTVPVPSDMHGHRGGL